MQVLGHGLNIRVKPMFAWVFSVCVAGVQEGSGLFYDLELRTRDLISGLEVWKYRRRLKGLATSHQDFESPHL